MIPSPVSSTPLHLESLPQPIFTSLQEPFEYPHQLIPINKADPTKAIGNGYTVQLSPTISTVFVYDVRHEFAGKACTLALHMPPPFSMPEMAPVHIRSQGGVSVSRIANQVSILCLCRVLATLVSLVLYRLLKWRASTTLLVFLVRRDRGWGIRLILWAGSRRIGSR